MSEGKPIVLNRETLIPIGLAVAMLLPLVAGWSWLSGKLDESSRSQEAAQVVTNGKLDMIDRRMERIEGARDGVMTKAAFEAWALRLSRDNISTVKVPEFHQ